MPVQQQSPLLATVSWPVQSGAAPPLAAYYSPRPETGFGAVTGQSPDQQTPLIRADETGSYVLAGPGGTGKTQLAAAYAQSLWQSGDIELTVWITASSRAAIVAGLGQAFTEASQAAGGPQAQPGTTTAGRGPEQEDLARQFLRWLGESTRSWLVVLDDLADPDDLAGLWPRGAMGRTVVTTRLAPASISPPGHQARLVQVGPFSRREALAFLTTRLQEDTAQRNGALDLAEALSCLPVALAQAAALIADGRIDCLLYRRQYDERRQATGIGPDGSYTATVAVTWSLALDRTDQLLPSALARPVLAMLSILDPNGVPAGVLTSAAAREYIGSYSPDRAPATGQQVRDVLDSLAQVGLIAIDPASAVRTVYAHALVQACVQQVLPPAVRDQAAAAAAGAVLQVWPEDDPDPQLDQALRDCAAALTQTTGDLTWSAAGRPLLLRAGRSLDAARLSGPAIAYWSELAEAASQALGDGDSQPLEYLQHLALAYEAAGRADLAVNVLTDSLARREEAQGPGHPETLTARGELARICLSAGRTSEALPHFERALAGREWVLGPDHPDTLAARNDLAAAYRTAGRMDDAVSVFRRTLADQEQALGQDHPTTVATRGSLAATLHAAGRMNDAIPLYSATLADRERMLGPDDPDTLTARGNLAYAYRSVGKLKDAIPLYSATLADRERVLGPDHPDTLTSRANLAAACFSARKLKDAIPLYERTVADRERVQGADHPDTLTARGNLASAYHSAGRLVVATDMYETTLAGYERVLGPTHENTLTSRANLAMAYYSARRMTDAISLFRRTLGDCEQALPPDHPLTQSVRESLEAATQG